MDHQMALQEIQTDFQPPMSPIPPNQRSMSLRRNPMSASVFDLNSQMAPPAPYVPQQFNPMMQAQSMAQLGCVNCHPHPSGPMSPMSPEWVQWGRRYGSNMSLNMPSDAMAHGAMWMGPWCGVPMYPPPMMHPQHNGIVLLDYWLRNDDLYNFLVIFRNAEY